MDFIPPVSDWLLQTMEHILDCRWRINDPYGVRGGDHSFQ